MWTTPDRHLDGQPLQDRRPAHDHRRRGAARQPSTSSASTPDCRRTASRPTYRQLLAEHIESLGEGWSLVRREYGTAIGPVDILARDADGASVAIEIKRRGDIDGVEQLTRYLELLNRDPLLAPVRGVFAAQEIKPQAKVLAERPRIELRHPRLRRPAWHRRSDGRLF